MPLNRRSFLRAGAFAAAAAALRPAALFSQADLHARMRQASAATPIKVTPLRDHLYLLQGVGGNMVAQTGPDGQLLIDTSFSPAVPRIRAALASLSNDPLNTVINTHWHFDHTDGNEGMHTAGVSILAHANTRSRLATPQEIRAYSLHIPPSPVGALPTITFDSSFTFYRNGGQIDLAHYAAAHTDTDIYAHFTGDDVLHVGDIWFNNVYPLIDDSSGGRIHGMIAASEHALSLSGPQTKIVPGHGPLGDKAALQSYRDMLSAARDRVAALKSSGASLEEAVAKKPTASLDSVWGRSNITPDIFVAQVYRTL